MYKLLRRVCTFWWCSFFESMSMAHASICLCLPEFPSSVLCSFLSTGLLRPWLGLFLSPSFFLLQYQMGFFSWFPFLIFHCGSAKVPLISEYWSGQLGYFSSPTFGNISGGTQNTNWKNISSPMFIVVFFTITEIWKWPNCPSVNEWRNNCGTLTQRNTTQL